MHCVADAIKLYSLHISCSVTSRIGFPNFPGIAFRGGFGHKLKESVCLMKKQTTDCTPCTLAMHCPYAIIFESPNVFQKETMHSATHVPHPFALTPLFSYPAVFVPGDSFALKLSLFGNAIRFLPHLLHALIALGESGIGFRRKKYKIDEIIDNSTGKVLYDGTKFYLNRVQPLAFSENISKQKLAINFYTPCKIKHNGGYLQHADMCVIAKNIKRRLEMISNFFGTSRTTIDIESVDFDAISIEKSEIAWEVSRRYSKRKQQHMPLGGFRGMVCLKGDVGAIYPLLKIGEAINLGSNTSFGFGAIKVESE